MSEQELPQECCAKCRFARHSTQKGWFDCHRFPPGSTMLVFGFDDDFSVAEKRVEQLQPTMDATEWCGEFQPRPAG